MFIVKEFSGSGSVPVSKFTLQEGECEAGTASYWLVGVRNQEQVVICGHAKFAASRIDGSSDFSIASEPTVAVDPHGVGITLAGSLAMHALTFSLSLTGDLSGTTGTVGVEVVPYFEHAVSEV